MSEMEQNDNMTILKSAKRDWFGYILTAIVGLIITFGATWWQTYNADAQASAAEYERLYTVRSSIVSLVEERVLNNLDIDAAVINRMIEQRRRELKVSLSLNINDVVDQAEFNIASSTYLSLEKKEEIKNLFRKFHAELSNKNFEDFKEDIFQYDLLNNIAANIKTGNSMEALTSLKRLSQNYQQQIEEANKKSTPIFFDVFQKVFSEKLWLLLVIYLSLFVITGPIYLYLKSRRRNYLDEKNRYEI